MSNCAAFILAPPMLQPFRNHSALYCNLHRDTVTASCDELQEQQHGDQGTAFFDDPAMRERFAGGSCSTLSAVQKACREKVEAAEAASELVADTLLQTAAVG